MAMYRGLDGETWSKKTEAEVTVLVQAGTQGPLGRKLGARVEENWI